MNPIDTALGKISGGRVLDVATGRGNFAESLAETLKDYTEIIGIDNSERAITAALDAVKTTNVSFQLMSGDEIEFPDNSFDMVSISNSVHHLDDICAVLSEMKRVLKPGGYFLLSEMYRDGLTKPQMTHVHLHHWWGDIDTGLGITHKHTFTRQELVDFLIHLGLGSMVLYDYTELEADPKDEKMRSQMEEIIDLYIERARGLPDEAELQQRGEALRQRLLEVGMHWASLLFVIGRK